MNYIILDNEWNTVYNKAEDGFLNELIEIGAVKFDERLREIDRFSVLIKSSFTKKLCNRFKQLTHITNEEMLEKGISFDDAINLYSEWAGQDSITLTWSNSDIYAILANMKWFLGIETIPFITKYVDLQKYVQDELVLGGLTINSQISVTSAAQLLNIDFNEEELHRALDDSLLCLEILKKVYNKSRIKKHVIDTYKSEYYQKLMFKPYVITDFNDPLLSNVKIKFKCPKCKIKAIKIGEWKFKRFAFKAPYFCKRCKGELVASATFKKHYDYVSTKKRIVFKSEEIEHRKTAVTIK